MTCARAATTSPSGGGHPSGQSMVQDIDPCPPGAVLSQTRSAGQSRTMLPPTPVGGVNFTRSVSRGLTPCGADRASARPSVTTPGGVVMPGNVVAPGNVDEPA